MKKNSWRDKVWRLFANSIMVYVLSLWYKMTRLSVFTERFYRRINIISTPTSGLLTCCFNLEITISPWGICKRLTNIVHRINSNSSNLKEYLASKLTYSTWLAAVARQERLWSNLARIGIFILKYLSFVLDTKQSWEEMYNY